MFPQSAHREDDGEERGHAEREECPDKEEGSAGLGDGSADSAPLHVDDGDDQPKERPEEDDDVPRSLSGQHQRSVQLDDENGQRNEVGKRPWLHPADDVVRQVKRHEEDRSVNGRELGGTGDTGRETPIAPENEVRTITSASVA